MAVPIHGVTPETLVSQATAIGLAVTFLFIDIYDLQEVTANHRG